MIRDVCISLCACALWACDDAREAQRRAEQQRIEAEYKAREEARAKEESAREDRLKLEQAEAQRELDISKERIETRSTVQETINMIEKHLAELDRGTKTSRIGDDRRALAAYRTTLQTDLRTIDAATPRDWPSVKSRVDKDIDDARQRISQLSLKSKT